MKVFYSAEGFMARSLSATNWALLGICVATSFKSSTLKMTDEEIVQVQGHIPVEPYRIASSAKEILARSASKMTPKGRDRTSKALSNFSWIF